MDSGYEKRLLSSPYTTPDKTNSPVRSPTKELVGDRYIPVRSNARWKIDFMQANRLFNASVAATSESPTKSTSPNRAPQPGTAGPVPTGNTAAVGGGGNGTGGNGSPQATGSGGGVGGTGGGSVSNASSSRARSRENVNGESRDMEMYRRLLSNELEPSVEDDFGEIMVGERKVLQARENSNMFSYKLKRESPHKLKSAPYSLSPVSDKSQRLLKSPRKQFRKIPKVPYKVLDAPELQDDFYLNLVDWSSQNILAVGLGTCVYLWSALTSQVTRLCDVSEDSDSITSVAWSEKGGHVAVGTYRGSVHIWDVAANKRVKDLEGHTMRVGALAWNGDLLASGSRDRHIMLRDTRSSSANGDRHLREHRQEVCGLKWSPDHQHLASGGNDNRLFVWNLSASSPVQTYTHHIAAVKAIAWSPHQHGLLASGGGTADRCIKFWNTLTGQPLQSIDTASQVCNLAWSIHSNELVSTHGYSQNQILVWKYPSLTQLAKLTGHTYRVLFLAMSPDGESIVTGAGDETLRFWNIFTKAKQCKPVKSNLHLFGSIR